MSDASNLLVLHSECPRTSQTFCRGLCHGALQAPMGLLRSHIEGQHLQQQVQTEIQPCNGAIRNPCLVFFYTHLSGLFSNTRSSVWILFTKSFSKKLEKFLLGEKNKWHYIWQLIIMLPASIFKMIIIQWWELCARQSIIWTLFMCSFMRSSWCCWKPEEGKSLGLIWSAHIE